MEFSKRFDISDGGSSSQDLCSVCLSPPPSGAFNGLNSFTYAPIRSRLQQMLLNEECCRQLYSYKSMSGSDMLHDFFDGKAFCRIQQQYGGYENIKNDIFLSISTDGFQPFCSSTEQVWPVLALILNLSPRHRYKVANIMPLSIVPGPTPTNLQSFMAPIIHEILNEFGNDGIVFKFYDGIYRRVRIHLVSVLGDLPVVSKLSGTLGHNARKPCRFCTITGVYSASHKHYYYPSRIHAENGNITNLYNITSLPTLTESRVREVYNDLQNSSGTELNEIRKANGIKEKSLLLSIPTLVPFKSFPIDVMHLLYNIAKYMIQHFLEDRDEACSLSKSQIDFIDSFLLLFKTGISSSMAPSPPAISKYKTWKAGDFKNFVQRYSLLLFENMLPLLYLKGWETFVQPHELVCRKSLTRIEVDEIGDLSVKFVKFVEDNIFRYEVERISVCKYVFHLLLHLKENVLENGPLSLCSQYWVERYIGSLVSRLNAKRVPATSLSNAALFNESTKMVYGTFFDTSDCDTDSVIPINGYKLLGKGKKVHLRSMDRRGIVRSSLKYYFARKYPGINAESCANLLECINKVSCFSGFRKWEKCRWKHLDHVEHWMTFLRLLGTDDQTFTSQLK